MPTYNKLVRDKILKILKEKGIEYDFFVANKEQYTDFLKEKLLEEVQEYLEQPSKEELADILEVVYALRDDMGIYDVELEKEREEKANKKGKFKDKIILRKTNR